jgi:hypothetical protein
MSKSVKFKKPHNAYQIGDGAHFEDHVADALVKGGVADHVEVKLPVRKGAEVEVKKEA